MSLSPELLARYWSFGIYVWVIGWLCFLMLGISYFLGARNRGRAGKEPFESGIVSVGNARLRLSSKFYVVGMMFVLFDIETPFLYVWAVSIRETSWVGFIEMTLFISVLLAGLVYLWKVGALDWSPEARRRHTPKPPQH